jgi:hemerythrin
VKLRYPGPELELTPRIEFPRATNPVWQSSDHMSANKTLLLVLLKGCSDYFQQVHMITHFGSSEKIRTNDPTFDGVTNMRQSPTDNGLTLLTPADCYDVTGLPCNDLDPNRLYMVKPPLFGLSSLTSRLRMCVDRLRHMDPDDFTDLTGELRFIMSAVRSDLRAGMNLMTDSIMDHGHTAITDSIAVLGVMVGGSSLVILWSLCFCALSWKNKVRRYRLESGRLLELLPSEEDHREMELVGAMLSHYAPLDEGRQRIIDVCLQLFDTIDQKEPLASTVNAHRTVVEAAHSAFSEEEKEMTRRGYADRETHTQHHLLLRQRLTLIGDQLRMQNDATTATMRRTLVSLFDDHFLHDDIDFAATIPESEKCVIRPHGGDRDPAAPGPAAAHS